MVFRTDMGATHTDFPQDSQAPAITAAPLHLIPDADGAGRWPSTLRLSSELYLVDSQTHETLELPGRARPSLNPCGTPETLTNFESESCKTVFLGSHLFCTEFSPPVSQLRLLMKFALRVQVRIFRQIHVDLRRLNSPIN
jgi:hypothetical protein